MSIIAVYNWIAEDTAAICASQATTAAGSLQLNGTLARGYQNLPGGISFGFDQSGRMIADNAREITFTSTQNLSGVNVTVSGLYLGQPVSQTRAGPNANTVNTTQLFETVTSVTIDSGVAASSMSVGIDLVGHTSWLQYNSYCPYPNMTVEMALNPTPGLAYEFVTTLDDIYTIASPYQTIGLIIPTSGGYTKVMNGGNASAIASFSYPVKYVCMRITDGGANQSATITIVQQGIR